MLRFIYYIFCKHNVLAFLVSKRSKIIEFFCKHFYKKTARYIGKFPEFYEKEINGTKKNHASTTFSIKLQSVAKSETAKMILAQGMGVLFSKF